MSGLPSAPPFGAVPPSYRGQQWSTNYPANAAGQAQPLSSFPQQQNSFSNSYTMPSSSFIPGLNSQPPQPFMAAPPFSYSGPPLPYHAPPIPTGPASHQNFRQHSSSFIPNAASLPPPPPLSVTSTGVVPGMVVPTGPRRSQPLKKPHGNKNSSKWNKPSAAVKPKSMEEREEGELSGDEEHITPVPEIASNYSDRISTDGAPFSQPIKHPRSKNTAETSQSRNRTPRTQVKLQAQEALRSLHKHNIKYDDMVKEGVDKAVLRRLYENAGIEVVHEEEPFNPSLAPKALLVPPAQSSVAESQTMNPPATNLPTKPSTVDKVVASPVPATTESAGNKPMERKDVIARMLALKSKKQASPSDEAAIAITPSEQTRPTETEDSTAVAEMSLPSSVPTQPTALSPKEPKQKGVNIAQTELARQRIEQLKKKASLTKSGASPTTAGPVLSTPVTQAPQQTSTSLLIAASTQLPLRPASSLPEPTPVKATATTRTCIPGLFMTADTNISAVEKEPTLIPSSGPDTSLPPKPPVALSAPSEKLTESSEPTPPSLPTAASVPQGVTSSLTPASVGQLSRKRPRAVDFNEDSTGPSPKRSADSTLLLNVPEYEPKVIIDISDDDMNDDLDYGDNVAAAEISGRASSRASAIASDGNGDLAVNRTNNNQLGSGSVPPSRSSPVSANGFGSKSAKTASGSDTYLKELMELKKRIAMFEEKKKEKKAQLSASGETTPALVEKQLTAPPSVTREDVQRNEQIAVDLGVTLALPDPSETKVNIADVTPAVSTPDSAATSVSEAPRPSPEASVSNITGDYRKSVLRKKVISSGLSALKSRIAENERRRAEMRKQEEALAAEIEKERAREMRLLDELEALERIATSAEQAQGTTEPAPSTEARAGDQVDGTAQVVEQRTPENQGAREDLTPGADATTVDRHEAFESIKHNEQPPQQTAAPDSQAIPSAVDNLIRESRPPSPVAAQAKSSSAADEKVDLGDEPMEESSGESSVMDESASVASQTMKKAQDDHPDPLSAEPVYEREGSYSPPEEVHDIQAPIAGAIGQVVSPGEKLDHRDVGAGAGADAAVHNVSSESAEVDVEMQDATAATHEPQSAQQTQESEDVEMQDGDASSQSDGYEPAEVMPEPVITVENDSYEPPEPEAITRAVHTADLDTGLTGMVSSQAQQQFPRPTEVDLGASKQTFDELTWTQQSTPSPSMPPDTQQTTSTYKPIFYTPYATPLRHFRAYRFHPDFLNRVAGGFRSLTYSNQINPNKEFCGFELSGGICNDKTCQYQHLADMALSDENVLLQLGHYREGKNPEDKERYVEGLKTIVTEMRQRGVKDFETVAKEITAYRRRFLQDDTRVLAL